MADPVYADGQLLVMTDNSEVTAFDGADGTRLDVHKPHGDSSPANTPFHRPRIIRNNDAFYALTPDGLLYTLPVHSR